MNTIFELTCDLFAKIFKYFQLFFQKLEHLLAKLLRFSCHNQNLHPDQLQNILVWRERFGNWLRHDIFMEAKTNIASDVTNLKNRTKADVSLDFRKIDSKCFNNFEVLW